MLQFATVAMNQESEEIVTAYYRYADSNKRFWLLHIGEALPLRNIVSKLLAASTSLQNRVLIQPTQAREQNITWQNRRGEDRTERNRIENDRFFRDRTSSGIMRRNVQKKIPIYSWSKRFCNCCCLALFYCIYFCNCFSLPLLSCCLSQFCLCRLPLFYFCFLFFTFSGSSGSTFTFAKPNKPYHRYVRLE